MSCTAHRWCLSGSGLGSHTPPAALRRILGCIGVGGGPRLMLRAGVQVDFDVVARGARWGRLQVHLQICKTVRVVWHP